VVNLCSKENLGRHHGVLVWQEKLAVEDAALVWGLGWSGNLNVEVSEVLLIWFSINTNDWILGQSLSFFHNSSGDLS